MNDRLLRCRVLWGTSDIVDGLPELRTVRDAIYLPRAPGAPWGLFGPDGERLGEAGDVPAGSDLSAVLAGSIETAPDEPYLYLGPMVLHYGHFVTDVLSRLWPLVASPDEPVRLLCHRLEPPGVWRETGFLPEIVARLGHGLDDIAAFDRPVRLRRVAVPAPSFRGMSHAHAVYGDLCRHVGRPFWSQTEVDTVETPVYLSKARLPGGLTHAVNDGELADELARRGVDVVHPERLSFAEQVALFARRTIVLGTIGSAFHTSLFSAPRRRIVGLNFAEHLNSNFGIFDRLNGNAAFYYFQARPEYVGEPGFDMSWVLRDPAGIAAELLDRIADLDRLEDRDRADEAWRARAARLYGTRAGRLRLRAERLIERAGRRLTGRGK